MHKEFEVIDVTMCVVVNEMTQESESIYRIYKNGVNEMMFISTSFEAMYDKSYEDSMDDLENALKLVNKDQTTQNQYLNIRKYNIVCRLLRKYHQGW
jgi:hypothetical protein